MIPFAVGRTLPESAVDDCAPGRLWSLLDMQRIYGDRLATVWGYLASFEGALSPDARIGVEAARLPAFRNTLSASLDLMEQNLREIGLSSCVAQVTRIRKQSQLLGVSAHGIDAATIPGLRNLFKDLGHRLSDELKSRHLLALTQTEVELYEPQTPILGKEVRDAFPSARYDVDEAGKCLGLSRSTAAVFHLMRVMEIGLSAVHRCLALPVSSKPADRNWGAMLRSIKAEVDGRNSVKPPRWATAADRNFFDEAYVSLDAVRNVWRNATMHVEQKYTPEEADHILGAVRGFMKKLASRMDEDGQPLA